MKRTAFPIGRFLLTAAGCAVLATAGWARNSPAELFVAALLGAMLLNGVRLHVIGRKLAGVRLVNELQQAEHGVPGAAPGSLAFRVALSGAKRWPVRWLTVEEAWTRTGGDGGVWICRRLLFLRQGEETRCTVSFEGAPRGVYRLSRTELAYGDLFGWFGGRVRLDIALAAAEPQPVLVIPPPPVRAAALPPAKPAAAHEPGPPPLAGAADAADGGVPAPSAGGMRGVELQAYRPGTPLRAIDWRTYAKRRVLAVRALEADGCAPADIAMDDVPWRSEAQAGQHAPMEAVLSAAAAAVRAAAEAGRPVRLLRLSDGAVAAGARQALAALAAERPGPAAPVGWDAPQPPGAGPNGAARWHAAEPSPPIRAVTLISYREDPVVLDRLHDAAEEARLDGWLTAARWPQASAAAAPASPGAFLWMEQSVSCASIGRRESDALTLYRPIRQA
ncbi:DUF58 domain-containing protein [Paenibacillus melissococcoides]|uniref:DUF58 domain-containing protein n=1 Tax=Paenibacillus melissococcoides TaxID=2912268 RepID=A0ABM9GA81_9BACL|nr:MULTISPECIES: DUF58 domain-containing protein [Paenibacillus]GIO78302.1 hypothetical protein J6TS7_19120 [Paenibacillus dendritiformis]CAH8248098.1 DUF58 domain-containing protein [Paenibacillus melissococcoides]CAH8718477.1 DUF58 domain-containing protein [Paenibacillus melissococcoides]CAH8718638.1 DUF58 domain-containing protein [Paenibacillus melissococcoides]